jgi:hypothetical protein
MSEEADKGRVSGWWALLAMPAALVLYVLSIGPAIMIVKRTGKGIEVVDAVYAPLEWLHDNTALGGPLRSYVNLWDRLTRTRADPPPPLP